MKLLQTLSLITLNIIIYRSNSRAPIQILEEPKDSVTSLHMTQYEIVSGSADGYIRTHDIRMGVLIADLISRKLYIYMPYIIFIILKILFYLYILCFKIL